MLEKNNLDVQREVGDLSILKLKKLLNLIIPIIA